MEAKYHIITDIACRILHYGTEIAVAKPGEDTYVLLSKGRHMLTFVSVENSKDSYKVLFEVPENDIEDFIEVQLSPYKEERIAAEQEQRRKEIELRKQEEDRRRKEEEQMKRIAEQKRLEEEREEREKRERMWDIKEIGDKMFFHKDGLQFTMIHIKGGSFMMGCSMLDPLDKNSFPQHKVYIDDFYIGQDIVRRAIYRKATSRRSWDTISSPEDPFCDSWDNCECLLKALREVTGKRFCFPTESQWVYAARKRDEYDLNMYDDFYEWTGDIYKPTCFQRKEVNPSSPENGRYRIYKGVTSDTGLDIVSKLYFACPWDSFKNLGLRLCLCE